MKTSAIEPGKRAHRNEHIGDKTKRRACVHGEHYRFSSTADGYWRNQVDSIDGVASPAPCRGDDNVLCRATMRRRDVISYLCAGVTFAIASAVAGDKISAGRLASARAKHFDCRR